MLSAAVIDRVTEAIEAVAAEEIMPRFRSLRDHEIEAKANGELVTAADIACEKVLSAQLPGLLPGSEVVGEEAVAAEPALMDLLDGEGPVWIIDPVDGTGNFARGTAVFAVMVALAVGGKTQAAWIHDPIGGRTAVAEAGSGAYMAGQTLKVAPAAAALSEMTGTLHASSFAPPEIAQRVHKRRGRVKALRSLRCAGAEYLRLITGEMQFTLFTRLMPWDHAPGVLLHQEAGGTARCFDGDDYGVRRHREIGVLMAPDGTSWDLLHRELLG